MDKKITQIDAVIDIGSNSVRLLVTSDKVINEKTILTTTLAENLTSGGSLSDEAMTRTQTAIIELVNKAKAKNPRNIYIFATEAVRASGNGRQFCESTSKIIGIPIDIISGQIEAKIGFIGASNGENVVINDIGGASVELISGNKGEISYSESLPLGVVRLLNICGKNRTDIEKYVNMQIQKYKKIPCVKLVSIGGTATTLASMDLNLKVYDPVKVHGHTLTLSSLDRLTDFIFNYDVMTKFPTLSERRAMVIGHGAIMQSAIMRRLDMDTAIISELDNMEGYLMYKNT